MKPCPVRPSSGSQLAEFVRWAEAEIRALQPIPTPGTLTGRGPNGTFRTPLGSDSAATASTPPQFGQIREVWSDTLTVELYSGEYITVQKPPHLKLHSLPAYDESALTTFRTGGGFPGQSSTLYFGRFSNDYLMRTDGIDGDGINESGWVGGAQSRIRLVFAPGRDSAVTMALPGGGTTLEMRFAMYEYVWPPYYAPAGYGGANGPNGMQDILVGKIQGEWYDMNLHARSWRSDADANGEATGWTAVIGGYRYPTIGTNKSYPRT